jgi:hypothetical protein
MNIKAKVKEELDRIFLGKGRRGELIYRGKGRWRRLPPGTAGQFLQTQGPNADPKWADVSGGGGGGGIGGGGEIGGEIGG